jgi:cytochrome-b5 reductase
MAIDLTYPLALLVLAGVAATNMASLPYAAGLVVVLLAILSFRTSMLHPGKTLTPVIETPKLRKVLKTDAYQNFELTEKNVISHNTASYGRLLHGAHLTRYRFRLPRPNDILGLPIGQVIVCFCYSDRLAHHRRLHH